MDINTIIVIILLVFAGLVIILAIRGGLKLGKHLEEKRKTWPQMFKKIGEKWDTYEIVRSMPYDLFDLIGKMDSRDVRLHYIVGKSSTPPKTLFRISHNAKIKNNILICSNKLGLASSPCSIVKKQKCDDPIFNEFFKISCNNDIHLLQLIDAKFRLDITKLINENYDFYAIIINENDISFYYIDWLEDEILIQDVFKSLLNLARILENNEEKLPR
jgi:hypothetical protein